MSDKFIKLTSASDDSTIVLNTKNIVKVLREEEEESTTIILSDSYDDEEVSETPEQIYSLLNRSELDTRRAIAEGDRGKPPKAPDQALQVDTHMQNLARHA